MSLENVERVRLPHAVRADSHRRLEERLCLRFPGVVALAGRAILRLPPRSRLRQKIVLRFGRLFLEAYNRKDFDAAYSLYGLRRWLAMVQDTWGEWRFDLERLIDADEQVIALVRIVAEGGASGVPVDREVAHVWSLRDGKASTAAVHLDRTEAFESVGLSE